MSIKSVRVNHSHFSADPPTGDDPVAKIRRIDFKTINRAKQESRLLGGAGYVLAFNQHPGDAEIRRLLGV